MRVNAKVRCVFDIEYEDQNSDIEYTKENISMMRVEDLLGFETEDSIQFISVIDFEKK